MIPRPLRVNRRIDQEFRIPIKGGLPDTYTIIAYLDRFILAFGQMPEIREAAVQIIGASGDHEQVKQLTRLADYVRGRVYYVLDPVGSEYIQSPLKLISEIAAQGFTHGDCDDHVLLLGALAVSLGIKSRAVGVKISDQSKRFDHVVNLFEVGGREIMIDACRKYQDPFIDSLYAERLISEHGANS